MYRRKDNRPDAPVTIYALKHAGLTIYIGQTCNTEERLNAHKCRRHFPKPITLEALEVTTAKDASKVEREWIFRAKALGLNLFNGEEWHKWVCPKCFGPLRFIFTTCCPKCASE
jgi:hypothetical protein